ncbi:MAG: bifunctional oligoribonuclease/PAP phosphatase NrnA [Candidatus Limnocylindrales bacterium]
MSLVDPVSLTRADLAAVPAAVVERLRSARRVLTVCHENPEADALGSALAHALLVEALGGRATPVCADPVPGMYGFMPGIERFRTAPDPDLDYDLIVVGDCGDLERVGGVLKAHAELFGRVPIVDIDHHRSNPGFGAVDWIDPNAAATCELTTLLAVALGVPLDAAGGALAANLVAGVVIDTANFQHPNTTPRTLRVASELVAAGAPLFDTARRLYRTKPNRQLKLFGLVLGRLEEDLAGRLVWSTLTEADRAVVAAGDGDSEGIIDLLSQSASAEVAILFKEAGGQTRISVRTREGGADAIALCAEFGGGGHARAAGATLELPLAEARLVVLEAARRAIAALRPR